MFRDREDAGNELASALQGRSFDLILAIPRGGVVVALPVAAALRARLDVVVPRKLGAPGHAELGIGAVAPGILVIDERSVADLHVPRGYLAAEAARAEREIERRTRAYRGDLPPPAIEGAHVLLVDDGVATGITAVAALRFVHAAGGRRVTFAAPVASPSAVTRLGSECDEVVVLQAPPQFWAVGPYYESFTQTTDEEVRAALAVTARETPKP